MCVEAHYGQSHSLRALLRLQSGNILDSNSGGARLEFLSGYWMPLLRFFVVFLSL
jgi:hypothetical protein